MRARGPSRHARRGRRKREVRGPGRVEFAGFGRLVTGATRHRTDAGAYGAPVARPGSILRANVSGATGAVHVRASCAPSDPLSGCRTAASVLRCLTPRDGARRRPDPHTGAYGRARVRSAPWHVSPRATASAERRRTEVGA